MKQHYKGVIMLQFAFCLMLIFHGKGSIGKPLTPDDVEGLLPPDPRDKNETLAAVVQDPVVQDAVHHTISNGSLNGLVIKKHVFIMPATNPNLILSKREHLLVVPTENLQDVKKNITEAKEAETQTQESLPENDGFLEDDESQYLLEGDENDVKESKDASVNHQSSNEKRKSETEFLRNKLTREISLAQDSSSNKVAVPIVAVIDPSNAEKGQVKSPIVAVLPHHVKSDGLNGQIQFLKDNGEKIREQAQDYIDQSSLTITPDYWKFSTPSEIAPSPIYSNDPAMISSYADRGASSPSSATNEMFLTPLIVSSQWGMLAPSVQGDRITDYAGETGDMDVAEDIIFRPLFRYRQETQQRSKYYDESNRRYSYTPYRNYDNYYPRRSFYRPQYNDY